jgi:GNAT superfamily N-acetyltransferase
VEVRALTIGTPAFVAARAYALRCFDRALLFLGDSSPAMTRHSCFFSATHTDRVRGVAVRFEGFAEPTVSCAADDGDTCTALIDAARPRAACTIVTHEAQPLSAALARRPAAIDTWLDCPCDARPPPHVIRDVCRLDDPREVLAFCTRHGARYVLPDMLALGHAYGARDANGELLALGLLQFALDDRSYAQLGGFLTAPHARGRGHATRLLAAIRCSLTAAGFARCGLFADAPDPTLPAFYQGRGFHPRGRFHFRALPARP